METPDEEIMVQVKAGRNDGLGILFDRHHRPLYGFFLRLTGQVHLSEDMVQEVFFRVLRYAKSFREGSAFKPWFYQVARRVHLDHVGERFQADPDLDQLPSPVEGPHIQAERLQDQERLERALRALPPDKRELLLLSRDPDLSYAELASIQGCSQAAVKVRVHRAMLELRAQFLVEGAS